MFCWHISHVLRSLISGDQMPLVSSEVKRVSEWNWNTKKPTIYLTWLIFVNSYFGDHDLQDNLRSNRGIRMVSEHRKTYIFIPHITYLHWFNILVIFWGYYRKEVKIEVGHMCLYQRMTCVVATIWKYVWLTGNNWITVKKVVFSLIFWVHGGQNRG